MPQPQPSNDSYRDILQQREAPPIKQKPPAPSRYNAPQPKPQLSKMAGDNYDYSAIDLEPIEQSSQQRMADDDAPTGNQNQVPSSIDKTDLDLEIERYQREIEEKQRRQRPQTQRPPITQQPVTIDDVYEVAAPSEEREPYQSPGQTTDQSDDQPLYFTSVNTDRQRKKMKRPVNPKTKPQGGFLSKFFNKENP
jgi:hypothetical protein